MIFDWGWSSIPKVPKITGLQYLCNISKKAGRMKLGFCLQINIKDFFKLLLSFQVCVARHAQITKNNKFAICNALRKKRVMKFIFLHTDKYESFLQIDPMILYGGYSIIPKVPKITSLQCLYNIFKKKFQM